MITCVEKTKIGVDCPLSAVSNDLYDAVVLPGGPGADKLGQVGIFHSNFDSHPRTKK